MMNSRESMMMQLTALMRPSPTRSTKAEVTRSLSAMGSMNLPKFVTSLRLRARWPSTQSVAAATMKSSVGTTRAAPSGLKKQ